MAKSRRGGYRQPNKPAPVATQNRNRTDGGAGSKKQPLRDMPGLPYGQQQQLLQQQQAAPLPAQGPMQINMNPPKEEVARPNVFAPTERPGESPTAGSPLGDGYTPQVNIDDMDLTLMAMYEVSKSPIILDLINRRS
jgi:hypothetical protein